MHRAAEAGSHHRSALALALARELGERQEEARALEGLGHVLHRLGRGSEARTHWRQAYDIYADIGAPEAANLRDRL